MGFFQHNFTPPDFMDSAEINNADATFFQSV